MKISEAFRAHRLCVTNIHTHFSSGHWRSHQSLDMTLETVKNVRSEIKTRSKPSPALLEVTDIMICALSVCVHVCAHVLAWVCTCLCMHTHMCVHTHDLWQHLDTSSVKKKKMFTFSSLYYGRTFIGRHRLDGLPESYLALFSFHGPHFHLAGGLLVYQKHKRTPFPVSHPLSHSHLED